MVTTSKIPVTILYIHVSHDEISRWHFRNYILSTSNVPTTIRERALEVANYGSGGPKTAPGGFRTFYTSPNNSPSQHELLQTDENNIEIDYELLVNNVENMLTADKARLVPSDITPKNLLVKSNPGLFGNMHPDITNPRDMYNFLSKSKFPKIADDSFLFARQTTLYENKLSRSNSFRDLNKRSDPKIKRKYHFHSQNDLSLSEKKDPSVVALNSNAPPLDDMTRLSEREKTEMTNFNLPCLNETGNDVEKDENNDTINNPLSLPVIKSAPAEVIAKSTQDDQTKRSISLGNRTKSNVTFSNKIDKWFSEMPSDITDRADRAIIQDSLREKLSVYNRSQRLDEKIPKFKRRNPSVKSLNQIQHHYLELRAGGPTSKTNKSDLHCREKQKSSSTLKTDSTIDKQASVYHEHKSSNFESENTDKETAPKDLTKSRNNGLNGLKKINLDQFAVDAYKLNPNKRFNFAHLQNEYHQTVLEEMNEDSFRRKADKEHWLRMHQPKTNPSIVNLCLDKGKVDNERNHKLRQTLSVIRMDGTIENGNPYMTLHSDHQHDQNHHESNSRSSSTNGSVKRKKQIASKSVLSKFNMLEVFGDGQNPAQHNNVYMNLGKSENPLVKLDLRYSRSRQRQSTDFRNLDNEVLKRQPHEMSTVDFRFGSGEVTIRRKPNGVAVVLPDHEIAAIKSPNAPPNNTEHSEVSANTFINGYSDTPIDEVNLAAKESNAVQETGNLPSDNVGRTDSEIVKEPDNCNGRNDETDHGINTQIGT